MFGGENLPFLQLVTRPWGEISMKSLTIGCSDAGDAMRQKDLFIPSKAKRDVWAKTGGFFAGETVVVLITGMCQLHI